MSMFAFLFLVSQVCAVQGARHVLWDATDRIPPSWTQTTRATATDVLTFHVALKHNQAEHIFKTLKQVSDPHSKQYAKYLSPHELKTLFAAPQSVQEQAESFFHDHEAECISSGSSLKCKATALAVEQMFDTEMYHFTRNNMVTSIVRHTNTLSIPDKLHDSIEFVTGLGSFFNFQSNKGKAHGVVSSVSGSGDGCGAQGAGCYVLPETIRTLYNVTEALATGSSKTSVGVAEFAGNYNINDADLKTFGVQVASKTTPLLINHRGGAPNDPSQQVSEEAQLDIQYTSGLGDGVQNWVWNQEHWMYALCQDLQNASESTRPSVISMSYAWSESAQCSGTTGAGCSSLGVNASVYVARTNQEFAKVGLLGISLLAASGDSGCASKILIVVSCCFRCTNV